MAIEIERKFLLATDAWRSSVERRMTMRQGYVAGSARGSVRVRTAGDRAWLNFKSGGLAARRLEFDYPIPRADADVMLATMCGTTIDKTRHFVRASGLLWEIDEFHGRNEGLVVAEIELESETQAFERPEWLGAEVTHLERYYNVRLVERPYDEWSEAERRP